MLSYSTIIRGDQFSPNTLRCISNVNATVLRAPGELVNGKTSTYGVCSFRGDSLMDLITKVKSVLDEVGNGIVDFVEINVTYLYEGQCNLEFSTRELDLIREVGGCLTVSCYQDG